MSGTDCRLEVDVTIENLTR